MATKNRTTLQVRHERQAAIPEAFALATLQAAIAEPRTEAQRNGQRRAQRAALRLIERGELTTGEVRS